MKFIVIFIVSIIACSFAAPLDDSSQAQILRYEVMKFVNKFKSEQY